MGLTHVHFEDQALFICYAGRKMLITDRKLRSILELFWDHPSIKRVFLVRSALEGPVLSKIKIMDKAEWIYNPVTFQRI